MILTHGANSIERGIDINSLIVLSYFQQTAPGIFSFEIGGITPNSCSSYIGEDVNDFKSFQDMKCGKFLIGGSQYGIADKQNIDEDFLSFEIFYNNKDQNLSTSWSALEFGGFGSIYFPHSGSPLYGNAQIMFTLNTDGRANVELFNNWDYVNTTSAIISKNGVSSEDVFYSAVFDKSEGKVYYYINGELVCTKLYATPVNRLRFSIEGSHASNIYLTQMALFAEDRSINDRNWYPIPDKIYLS